MATVRRHLAASPQEVYDRLCDGWCYASWVVGTSYVRAVDAQWPAVGSRLHHASGPWPLALRDITSVEEVEPGRLVLTAKGRPLGSARIELGWEPAADGTLVTMTETPSSGPGAWLHNPVLDAVLARRNTDALERLAGLVERPTAPPA